MRPNLLLLAALATLPLAAAQARAEESRRFTYSAEFLVVVSERDPTTARVRWKLSGIDEIASLRLDLRGIRIEEVSGTGRIEQHRDELRWVPGAPYAHLEYRVPLRRRRAPNRGYDSYAAPGWVVTRFKMLFPRVRVSVNRDIEPHPAPRCRVVFLLPRGWTAYTAMEEVSPGTFRPPPSGRLLDLPKGWLALGENLRVDSRQIGPTRVTVVRVPGSSWNSQGMLDLYSRILPELESLLGRTPQRLLVVSAPDPMWHGGISGRDSFFVHGDRPLRTPDRTSPPVHELFHVLAPFRPARDGLWITEGLAEYYSLALPHRLGWIDDQEFERGLRLFARYGEWNVDLTTRRTLAVTNNSAPLVLHAIDRALRKRAGGSLDDVVRRLARAGAAVSTASFLEAVNRSSGKNFAAFFQRHVHGGIPPPLPRSGRAAPGPAATGPPVAPRIRFSPREGLRRDFRS